MSEATPRALSHFALLRFTTAYWALSAADRLDVQQRWYQAAQRAAGALHLYQVFPAGSAADLCAWSWVAADSADAGARFFTASAAAIAPCRRYLELTATLWGYSRPSQYSTARRSAQALTPDGPRRTYLVIYPFTKTTDWYLAPHEERQAMMSDHIRIGKQYTDVSQLLLYSFGLQDQEFVVVYEMDCLERFSDLVAELRTSPGRAYTARDTPLHTCVWHPAEETLELFR
jgi:chlorite dismutase